MGYLVLVLYTPCPFTSDIHRSFVEHFQQRFIAWENAFFFRLCDVDEGTLKYFRRCTLRIKLFMSRIVSYSASSMNCRISAYNYANNSFSANSPCPSLWTHSSAQLLSIAHHVYYPL